MSFTPARLIAALQAAGDAGLSRRELNAKDFRPADELMAALSTLYMAGLVRWKWTRGERGRPKQTWYARRTDAKQPKT